MSLQTVPRELAIEIVRYLPVDGNLVTVALVCRALHSLMMEDVHAASDHVLAHVERKGVEFHAFFRALVALRTRVAHLPFAYKCALFLKGITADPRSGHDMRFEALGRAFGPSEATKLLHFIAKHEHEPVANHLKVSNPRLALWAADAGLLDPLREILAAARHSLATLNNALHLAAAEGHVEVVSYLINQTEADPASDNNSAIRHASTLETARALLSDPRTDPSDNGNEALLTCLDTGRFDVARFLLTSDARVHPSAQSNRAVVNAVNTTIVERKMESLDVLIADARLDADAFVQGLMLATRYGDAPVVELLLKDSRAVLTRMILRAAVRDINEDVMRVLVASPKFDRAALLDIAGVLGKNKKDAVEDMLSILESEE
ncbi:hypothetical protein BC830DRAFT_1128444 [Chytriomyces sp. MP71]|nr:hypothetical protein BC830DRAFT_1128444 [Chytriomyces sp. MP71]